MRKQTGNQKRGDRGAMHSALHASFDRATERLIVATADSYIAPCISVYTVSVT
jgi:hypothetical protein